MGKTTKPTPSAPSRFVRSVNLEHDLWRPDALDGYVVTAGVRRALMRVAPATTDAHASRVWTVTGPYGTGKSALVLFLAWLFSHAAMGLGSAARRLLRESDKDLAAKILGAAGATRDLLEIECMLKSLCPSQLLAICGKQG